MENTEMFDEQPNMAKVFIDRISLTLVDQGMTKRELGEKTGLSLPKISKIFKGMQGLTFEDATKIANALGYPLEAFTAPEFDLAAYEETHSLESFTLRECIVDSINWLEDGVAFKEAINKYFPRTIRKILNIDSSLYEVVGSDNMSSHRVYTGDGRDPILVSHRPFVIIRSKQFISKNRDYLSLGYWFDEGRNYMALAIVYFPDDVTSNIYQVDKKKYFKSMVGKQMGSDLNDTPIMFADELFKGEIASKVYEFESSKMDEETLIEDLKKAFDIFKRILDEASATAEATFWKVYNEIATEAGPTVNISGADVVNRVKSFVIAERRNPMLAEEAKARADYKCEICGSEAPFTAQNGKPYLEVHHLVPMSQRPQGCEVDTLSNLVCVCPNCHKKIHCAENQVREQIIVDLYYKRKPQLAEDSIDVSLAKLLQMNGLQ